MKTEDAVDERGLRAKRALVVGAVAFFARLAVVIWAAGRIPAAADGTYYHTLATRLAAGDGYTWRWPDGVVTYAAHYPVGYPALAALGYATFGPHPVAAMIVNLVIGTAGAVAVYDLLARTSDRWKLALFGGLAAALHPALVPYTAALMTEGVTASLLAIAAACAARARETVDPVARTRLGWGLACGLVLGVATLVRPQSLVFAPALGWLAVSEPKIRSRALAAVVLMALALLVCAPWTARNCVRMKQCSLVSVNGGWNLAIGTQTTSGTWQAIEVPDACKEVFDEAGKDACFGREARKVIAADPLAWLARAPKKVRATFDYLGAAPWYLHEANGSAFGYGAKVTLGTIETIAVRLALAAALVSVWRLQGPRARARKVVAGVGLLACVLVPGALAYLALAAAIGLLGRRTLESIPIVVPATAVVILATAATHAVFFGAGRYGLVVLPFVTALAFVRLRAPG